MSIQPATLANTQPDAPASGDVIPPEHIAAIAAAVHFLAGKVAILRIEDNGNRNAWVAQGRAVLHTSHNPIRSR